MKKIIPHRIIISRTDAIGDVILTLPAAGLIKKYFPECRIIFFGRTYTKAVVDACEHVDEFINYDDFTSLPGRERPTFLSHVNADAIVHVFPRPDIAAASKAANIHFRIGTTNRLYHWWTCNRLIPSGRKNSDLHEAQLNVKLLRPFGITNSFHPEALKNYLGLKKTIPLPEVLLRFLSKDKFNLLLHPKSNTSAREWSLENYRELILMLPPEKFNPIVTGTNKEKELMKEWLSALPQHVQDATGRMSLHELISFIGHADGLVAASTGPLHIAGALGKHALGIYSPIRPMHPGRWAAIGDRAEFLVATKTCSSCRTKPTLCHCMNEISPKQVAERILGWKKG